MKRKILSLALVLIIAFSFGGCGKPNEDGTPPPSESQTAPSSTEPSEQPKVNYPTKNIECIMAASAGGGTDLQVRAIAPFFKNKFGKELIPIAMPGGSGTIGMTELANRSADGYSIGVPYTGGVSIMPSYGDTAYNADSFRYIAQYSNSPIVLAVNAKGNIKSVDDLIEYGKTQPVLYSCAANGAIDLAIQAFAQKAGISMTNIPVEGAAPGITNVLGNQVQAAGIHPTNIYAYIESGDLLPIVIFEAERFSGLPDTPTAKELGVDMVASVWNGLAVPKDTPDEIYNILVEGFAEIFADPDCIAAIENLGATVDYLAPDAIEAKIEQEKAMYAELIASKK